MRSGSVVPVICVVELLLIGLVFELFVWLVSTSTEVDTIDTDCPCEHMAVTALTA